MPAEKALGNYQYFQVARTTFGKQPGANRISVNVHYVHYGLLRGGALNFLPTGFR
jgi:hypothetical protein